MTQLKNDGSLPIVVIVAVHWLRRHDFFEDVVKRLKLSFIGFSSTLANLLPRGDHERYSGTEDTERRGVRRQPRDYVIHLPSEVLFALFFLSPAAAIAFSRSRSFSRILIFSEKLSSAIRACSFGFIAVLSGISVRTDSTLLTVRVVSQCLLASLDQQHLARQIAEFECDPSRDLFREQSQPSVPLRLLASGHRQRLLRWPAQRLLRAAHYEAGETALANLLPRCTHPAACHPGTSGTRKSGTS